MKAGVSSRGSPIPKSMTSTPRASAARRASRQADERIGPHPGQDRAQAHAKRSSTS